MRHPVAQAPGRSEGLKIPGVPVLFGGHILPPLAEIRLTDLPKSGAPPAPPGTTSQSLRCPIWSSSNRGLFWTWSKLKTYFEPHQNNLDPSITVLDLLNDRALVLIDNNSFNP